MGEIKWDIQEVKSLKKKLLVQYNIVMLLLFFLIIYFENTGASISAFFSLICLFIWFITALEFYTILTGKMFGTKTSRLVQTFEKDNLGAKQWKSKKWKEIIFLLILSVMCTVFVTVMDFNSLVLVTNYLLPFIGSWLGMNIGNIYRIVNLERDTLQ